MPILYPNTSEMIDISPIEPGVYPAKVIETEAKTSKSGNAMVVVKLEVDVNGKPRTRTAYCVVSGKGSGQFDQLLRACHYDDLADQFKAGEQVPFDTDDLLTQQVMVRIDAELDDSGNSRDKIGGFLKA